MGRTLVTTDLGERCHDCRLTSIVTGILRLQLCGDRFHIGGRSLVEIPSLSRPMPLRLWQLRRSPQLSDTCRVVQNSALPLGAN